MKELIQPFCVCLPRTWYVNNNTMVMSVVPRQDICFLCVFTCKRSLKAADQFETWLTFIAKVVCYKGSV